MVVVASVRILWYHTKALILWPRWKILGFTIPPPHLPPCFSPCWHSTQTKHNMCGTEYFLTSFKICILLSKSFICEICNSDPVKIVFTYEWLKCVTSFFSSTYLPSFCLFSCIVFAFWRILILLLSYNYHFLRLPLMDRLTTWTLTLPGTIPFFLNILRYLSPVLHITSHINSGTFYWNKYLVYVYVDDGQIYIMICSQEILKFKFHCSVQNLEIIEPLHSTLWGTSNKKRSLFHMLKTTKTIGGYVLHYTEMACHTINCFINFRKKKKNSLLLFFPFYFMLFSPFINVNL